MKAIDILLKCSWNSEECDEAIEEIETLQNRTCESCKYDYKCSIQDSIIKGHEAQGLDISIEFILKPFCCNRYEKEIKLKL